MKRIVLTAVAVCMAFVLAAQESSRKVTLTLDEAIKIALDENPTIKIADMEVERQDYARRETVGNLLPSLSASGDYSYSIVKQKMSKSGLSFGADNTITVGATLAVPLFVPAVYAALQLNEAQMADAVESARSSRLSMVNEVRKAYYNILLLNESLDVLHESEALMEETVANAKNMYEAQLGSEYDYLTALSNLSSIKPNIIQTQGSIEVAYLYMHMLLSMPNDVEIELVGSLDDYSDEIVNSSAVYSTDISGNTTLRSLEIQERMLEAQLRAANAQRIPTISAFGTISFYGNDMPEIDFGDMGFGDMFGGVSLEDYPNLVNAVTAALGPSGMSDLNRLLSSISESGYSTGSSNSFWWQHPARVGVSISIPIFSGNKINSQVKQARIAIEQLRMQREYQEEATGMEVRTAISNLITARSSMEANQTAMAQARKAFDISNVRYRGGMGTILELNTSQFQFTQAQLNYTQAVYDYLAAQADYEQIVGLDYEVDGE